MIQGTGVSFHALSDFYRCRWFHESRFNYGLVSNTAVGVQRVPADYMNVARVLNLSEWKIVSKILFPSVLPCMLTGVRLSVGTAWLVIVAAEMLVGGTGIGYFVWNEWNNLSLTNVIFAILVIGIVGMALDLMFARLQRAISYVD